MTVGHPAPKSSKALGSAYVGRTLEDDGRATFDAIGHCFERALGEHPGEVSETTIRIGEEHIRLRVVGRQLARLLLTPFAHIEQAGSQPSAGMLTIDAWDQAATGSACAVLPAEPELAGMAIVVRSRTRRFFRLERPTSSMWLDTAQSRMLGWFASAAQATAEELSKPFYRMLGPWLAARGIHMIHAALVARDGRGALLTGRGGAGKSTTALSCLIAGLDCLGDDYVGLQEMGMGGFRGLSLYSTCCIEHPRAASFPELRDLVLAPSSNDDDKSILALAERFASRLPPPSALISAVLLPRVTSSSTTSLRAASPIDALRELAPSSLLLLPDPGPAAFQAFARMVERVPAYWLDLGGPLESAPPVIAGLLDSLPARSAAPAMP
jgi:hypothetical protein